MFIVREVCMRAYLRVVLSHLSRALSPADGVWLSLLPVRKMSHGCQSEKAETRIMIKDATKEQEPASNHPGNF